MPFPWPCSRRDSRYYELGQHCFKGRLRLCLLSVIKPESDIVKSEGGAKLSMPLRIAISIERSGR